MGRGTRRHSIIWSVSSHNSASSKGKLCCRQKNHQKAASLSAVLCAVQLNRLSSKSHCTYNKYRIIMLQSVRCHTATNFGG